jgi:hypothetical protein
MNVRYELQNLISRTGGNSKENLIAAAAHYLAKSKRAGRELEKNEFTKDQEATLLIDDPDAVKSFLIANGFQHKKNNDYFHLEMSIILEDLHDENVLTY